MKVTLYQNATIYESVKSMFASISTDDLKKDNVVIVPDRFSLLAEKLLLQILPNKALFNVRVKTLTSYSIELLKRFNLKISPEDCLSNGEILLLTRQAIVNVNDRLLTFKKTNIAFCREMAKLISQLKSSDITSQMINAELGGRTGQKYHDLKLIMEEYENLLGSKLDANKRMALLNAAFEGRVLENTNVYFAGFEAFTKVGYEFIKNIIKSVCEVGISVATPIDRGNEYIYEKDIFQKVSKISGELGLAVEVVSSLPDFTPQQEAGVKGLFSYHNVKCENAGYYNLYCAQNIAEEVESIAKHIYFLTYNGYRYKNLCVAVSDLTKYQTQIENIFDRYNIPYYIDTSVSADKTLLARLVNDFFEVVNFGYSGERLCNLFSNILLGDLAELIDICQKFEVDNKIKYKQLLQERFPFSDILSQIEGAKTCKEIGVAIENLLGRVKENFDTLMSNLERKGELKEKNINIQMFEIMRENIDLLNKYHFDDNVEYQKALNLLLSFVEVSTVPTYVDGVMIGDAGKSSFASCEVLYLLGGQSLPMSSNDNGLLSDKELGKSIHEIEPTIQMINRRERFKLFNLLSLAGRMLVITYQNFGDEGKKNSLPSYILSLNKIFDVLPLKCGNVFFEGGDDEDRTLLAFERRRTLPNLDFANRQALKRDAKELYFPNNEVKVTQIERYFTCPFKHFVDYGLALKEFELKVLDQRDVGNICHKCAEIYLKKGIKNNFNDKIDHEKFVEENLDYILESEKVSEKLEHLDEKEAFIRLIKRQLIGILQDIDRELSKTAFRPKYIEMKFDKFYLLTKNGKFNLVGRADRIDEAGNYFRIIDYKTGSVGNVVKGLFYGEKLQLFLYQRIASEVLGKIPGGGYYFNAKLEYSKDNEDRVILKGIARDDDELISYLDSDIEAFGKSGILSLAKAAKGGYKGSSICKEGLDRLTDYSVEIVKNAIDEICQGYIAPKPTSSSCQYCTLQALCGYEKDMGIRRNDKGAINFGGEE